MRHGNAAIHMRVQRDRRGLALLALLVLRALLPDSLQYLLAGRSLDVTTSGIVVAGRVAAASAAARLLDLLIIGFSALLVLDAMRGAGRQRQEASNPLLGVLIVLWALALLSSLTTGTGLRLSSLAVGAGLMSLAVNGLARQHALAAGAHLTVLAGGSSLLLAFVLPDVAFMASTDERAYLFTDRRLSGLLPHPNALGQVLAFGLPAVMAHYSSWRRAVCVVVVVVALLATASRTSAAAAAIVLALGLLALGGKARSLRIARQRLVLGCGLVAALFISLIPAIGGRPPALRSPGRVVLWDYASVIWTEQPILGHGPEFWSGIAARSRNFYGFAFHAHNLWLEVLVTLGVAGTVVLAALVVRWGLASLRFVHVSLIPGLMCATFLVNAATEVPISLLLWDSRLVLLVIALSTTVSLPRSRVDGRAISSELHAARRG